MSSSHPSSTPPPHAGEASTPVPVPAPAAPAARPPQEELAEEVGTLLERAEQRDAAADAQRAAPKSMEDVRLPFSQQLDDFRQRLDALEADLATAKAAGDTTEVTRLAAERIALWEDVRALQHRKHEAMRAFARSPEYVALVTERMRAFEEWYKRPHSRAPTLEEFADAVERLEYLPSKSKGYRRARDVVQQIRQLGEAVRSGPVAQADLEEWNELRDHAAGFLTTLGHVQQAFIAVANATYTRMEELRNAGRFAPHVNPEIRKAMESAGEGAGSMDRFLRTLATFEEYPSRSLGSIPSRELQRGAERYRAELAGNPELLTDDAAFEERLEKMSRAFPTANKVRAAFVLAMQHERARLRRDRRARPPAPEVVN